MKANKGHLPMNYKRADNRSSWLTGYRLCVYASGSVITDVLVYCGNGKGKANKLLRNDRRRGIC